MNRIKLCWKMFWLRRTYLAKLDEVAERRFEFCKYGTTHKQREIVHEWYHKERSALIKAHKKSN